MCDSLWIEPHTLVIPKDEKNDEIRKTLIDYFKGSLTIVEREKSKIFSNDAYVVINSEQVQTWTPLNEYLKQA